MAIEKIMEEFDVSREQISVILRLAVRSLDARAGS